MADYIQTKLDADQVIARAYDEPNNRLRVDAQVSATIGNVEVTIDAAAGDNIKISDGVDTLNVNPDGSINVNVTDLAIIHTADSVALGNGIDKLATITTVGPKNGLDVNIINSSTGTNNLNDGFGNPITSSSNNLQNHQVLHTLTPDSASNISTFSALNNFVSLEVTGLASVGFQLSQGTFKGILYAQASVDGGINWVDVTFYDPANSSVLTYLDFSINSNPLVIVSIIPIGGASHVRVLCKNYTSGTASGLLRASNVTGAVGSITASAFGTVVNNYVTVLANTPTLILAANTNRKFAYISNNSGATIAIQLGSSVGMSTVRGLAIQAETYYQLQGTNLYTGNVYAVCSTEVIISVTEGSP